MMRVIAPAPRDTWREVLASDAAALPEHAPEWLDAMADLGTCTDASRLYEFRDGRRFVLPLARRRGPGGLGGRLESYPPAWGIGGLVGKDLDAQAVRAVVADLRSLPAARISLRPDPTTAEVWAQATRGTGVLAIPRRAHVIDLTAGADAAAARMSKSTRRGLRLAQKRGVTIRSDRAGRLLPVYHELYRRSVERWAAYQHEPRALAHWRAGRRDPLEKLYAMADRLGGRMWVAIADVDGVPAAGAITLFGPTAHDIRSAMDHELASHSRAGDLLQWASIAAACDAGCSALHLGETGGSQRLAVFKERFGAASVPYAEYRIERLPVTAADRAARGLVKKVLRFRDV